MIWQVGKKILASGLACVDQVGLFVSGPRDPPDDGWMSQVIWFNIAVHCVLALEIFLLYSSSAYYFAADLWLFLVRILSFLWTAL